MTPTSEPEAAALSPLQLLTLARWLSPAFPTGAFAWSHGLEQAVGDGTVRDAGTLEDWLDAVLRHGAGRTDAILIGAAHRAKEADLPALAELATALAPSRERRAEAAQQGAAFATTLRALHGWDLPDAPFPVTLGRAARLGGLPARPVAEMALQGFVTTLTQAAQRLMPLGQTAAQGVILRLAPPCAAVAAEGMGLSPDDIGSCALAVDLCSMRHEGLEPRIFRS
ncbi:urease accessory protein UreF [Rubellimicrobium roseum]|uniref:Urease accessory protein UreF n=1 Tax=Rubellimicrobium roseum TaxID=687525 RepID=A0A5C4N8H0_9RHOB|nr:urease accessory UreF family protein [Rubellimicrobium roseum]TNC65969.1 urease accessory protein UreF [Rubellimicrobium roseum]